jgi:signal transduction histidine kinase
MRSCVKPVAAQLRQRLAQAVATARRGRGGRRPRQQTAHTQARVPSECLGDAWQPADAVLNHVNHVSDELRTPLTIIHGYAELLADGQLSGADVVRSTAREIHASSSHVLRVLDDLLETSRLDAGQLELRTERVDLAPWLARTAATFARATPSHQVVVELPEALPYVRADLGRLGRVLNDLLASAAQQAAEGTRILVTAHVFDSGRVEIQVRHQGPAIAPRDSESVCDNLSAVNQGPDLALARRLVEAHGGDVGVRGTLGQGSSVWLRLPADVPSLPAEPPVWIDPDSLAA